MNGSQKIVESRNKSNTCFPSRKHTKQCLMRQGQNVEKCSEYKKLERPISIHIAQICGYK